MQPSISDQIEISDPRSVVSKHVANKCGKFRLRYDVPLPERDTVTYGHIWNLENNLNLCNARSYVLINQSKTQVEITHLYSLDQFDLCL
jgi:hypothetical protein